MEKLHFFPLAMGKIRHSERICLGDGMKKALLIVVLALLLVGQTFADSSHTSVVTLNSIVLGNVQENPNIVIGIQTSGDDVMTSSRETTTITGLNLTADGSFSFVLMTSEQVILSATKRTQMEIEITAEGFDLYDYDYTGASNGSSGESKAKMKSAVPLLSTTPEINIPTFFGNDQNVSVSHINENKNKISIMFLPGMTKENLVLGTFTIDWKGKRPLDAGIYMASVSIKYSTN